MYICPIKAWLQLDLKEENVNIVIKYCGKWNIKWPDTYIHTYTHKRNLMKHNFTHHKENYKDNLTIIGGKKRYLFILW